MQLGGKEGHFVYICTKLDSSKAEVKPAESLTRAISLPFDERYNLERLHRSDGHGAGSYGANTADSKRQKPN